MLKLSDYEREAKKILPAWVVNYVYGASEDGDTYEENFKAIKRYLLKPRMLRNVSNMDTTTTILGYRIAFPVCTSPTASHKFVHAAGEIGSSRGVTEAGLVYTLSQASSTTLEEVAQACPPDACLFLNIYIFKDRKMVVNMIRKAEASGYKALVVTVDAPSAGPGKGKHGEMLKNQLLKTPYTLPNIVPKEIQFTVAQHDYVGNLLDSSLTWKDVAWIKSITSLPIIAKGILSAEDAELAIEVGVSGILVSNHGGRQLGSATATMDVLREVVLGARGRCEVYVDGGFRTGSDVLKALALGARVVFIGRPVIYALAHAGAEGVKDMLDILKAEFIAAMAMSGCSKISDITPALVRHHSQLPSKI